MMFWVRRCPSAPAYGSNSIADVLESASSGGSAKPGTPAHALDADPAFTPPPTR